MAAIDEITIPGGVCVFFTETGGTERQLGNIVGDSLSIDRDSDEIEHYSNKSGIRRKDKIFTIEENAQIDFELDEINLNNLRYFFKGGAISTVGAGTATVVDQKETLGGEKYISVEKPGLTVTSLRTFLDNVFLDDNGTFIDHSVAADDGAASNFASIGTVAVDFLYLGKGTQWKESHIDVGATPGAYAGLDFEYWNGTIWTALIGLVDNTSDLSVDGAIVHTPQSDWVQSVVNGVSQYWVRLSEPTTVTTPATLDNVGRLALTDHTDYDVDPGAADATNLASNGAYRRIAAGSLADGEEVKVSFTYVTFDSQTFGIAEQSILEGSARLINAPQAGRGTTWEMIIPRAQLKNNGSMDLDDTDFQTIPLSLVLLDDSINTPTNPFGTIRVSA